MHLNLAISLNKNGLWDFPVIIRPRHLDRLTQTSLI